MFLNYFIDERLRPFVGVDVSKLGLKGEVKSWLRWNRTLMGFRSSPYIACKMYGWTLDVCRGNRFDPENPFRWDSVRVNLPGTKNYNPRLPWISKMKGNSEAAEVIAYVDDVRNIASSELDCRKSGKRISQVTTYLGEQDAWRKTRPPSQKPGPWCGSFVVVEDENVFAYVSLKKWNKGKAFIASWLNLLKEAKSENRTAQLNHKDMERGRGFLVYLSRTYTSIVPYLKGIHLTIDSWRGGRDEDGWKLRANARRYAELKDNYLLHSSSSNSTKTHTTDPPNTVSPVRRLFDDLTCLNEFFDIDTPPWRFVRGKTIYIAKYGFADASKSGFGSSIETDDGIVYRYGTWSTDGEEHSSNFRELKNLATTLECEIEKGNMKGVEVFIFTDNSTAESAYYKGTSSSRLLFDIIFNLRKLEFSRGIKIHFIHVAGTRMIVQGTDGLSRGDLSEGVMKGMDMLSFIPLHLSVFERSKNLKSWFKEWIVPCLKKNEKLEFLTVEDWFWRGQDLDSGSKNDDNLWIPTFKPGIFVWSPAPAAGQFAVEQLRNARNKRTNSIHFVVIPRLFTSIWRRQLTRVADLFITLPFIPDIWSKDSQHEPLTLAVIFPFLSHSPWQLKRSKSFLEMERYLRGVWEDSAIPTGFVLCKLLGKTRNLYDLSPRLVCQLLQAPQKFKLFHNATRE